MIERYSWTGGGRYNIARGQQAPVRRGDELVQLRWGMTPPWRGHGGKRGPLVYGAELGEVARVPMLRDALKKQRCLVIADGFYVWKDDQPWWFHGDGDAAFAGVWGERDDGIASFAVLHAGELPAVVRDEAAWLAGSLDAIAAPTWRSHRVSTWVNAIAHDDAKCVAPIGNPAQGELF